MNTRLDYYVYCPTCKLRQDQFEAVVGKSSAPIGGDVALCYHCGAINIVVDIGDKVELRSATKEDLKELHREFPSLYRIMLVESLKIKSDRQPEKN
jgi:hypothetical protein